MIIATSAMSITDTADTCGHRSQAGVTYGLLSLESAGMCDHQL
jgi:hypothetical protein